LKITDWKLPIFNFSISNPHFPLRAIGLAALFSSRYKGRVVISDELCRRFVEGCFVARGRMESRFADPTWGMLPPRMRVLYVAPPDRDGGWLAEAFAADSACEILLKEARGAAAGMTRLREEVFDAVLVAHRPDALDALDFIEGLRAAGSDDAVIVLAAAGEQELSALCFEVGADGYRNVDETTTRGLIWTIARAVERRQLLRENHQLQQGRQQRLTREHQEAERLITQQRTLIQELQRLRRGESEVPPLNAPTSPPEDIVARYREILRTYVVMGSGNLTREMERLAESLVAAGASAQRTMQLHVEVLEELLAGLGNRGSRHVMNRAELLVLEMLTHLCEGYRQKALARGAPPAPAALRAASFAPPEADLRRHRGYA
jgi:DNA-binding NarL/FixJ family response regulator